MRLVQNRSITFDEGDAAVLNDNFNNEAHLCMAAVVSSTSVPNSIQEALDDPNWKAAMKAEFVSLVENKVLELVPKPANRKIIGGKWHFVVKYIADGKILKYKARYVAKGFTQVFGADYNETYSPTVRLTSLRCLWAIAAQQKGLVYQMDSKTAYMNAPSYRHNLMSVSKLNTNGEVATFNTDEDLLPYDIVCVHKDA